jgi:hypothetical protein
MALNDIDIIDAIIYHSSNRCMEIVGAWERIKTALQSQGAVANKPPTKVICIQACSLGKHSDSEWQRGFDIGLSAMYDYINGHPTVAATPCPKYESCAHRIVCKYLPNGSCVGEYDVWPVG